MQIQEAWTGTKPIGGCMRGNFRTGYPLIRDWLSPAYTTPALFIFEKIKHSQPHAPALARLPDMP